MTGPFLRRQGEGAKVGPDARVGGDALALVEVSSIVRGHVVADAMCKKAPIELVLARPISPGKHVTLIVGAVADVKEAVEIGVEVADDTYVDRLELAQVAPHLIDALRRSPATPDGKSRSASSRPSASPRRCSPPTRLARRRRSSASRCVSVRASAARRTSRCKASRATSRPRSLPPRRLRLPRSSLVGSSSHVRTRI